MPKLSVACKIFISELVPMRSQYLPDDSHEDVPLGSPVHKAVMLVAVS